MDLFACDRFVSIWLAASHGHDLCFHMFAKGHKAASYLRAGGSALPQIREEAKQDHEEGE